MTTTAVLSEREISSAHADLDIGACLAAAIGDADSYARHRALYEDWLGYTRFDGPTHALTVRAHRFRAMLLSARHGQATHNLLGDRPLPIFTSGSGHIQVFLSAIPAPDDDVAQLEQNLFRTTAVIAGANAEVALPTPGNDRRRWLSGLPPSLELPTYLEVVTAVTEAQRG